ncbi:MAG: P-loop NTPase [Rhodobacteraceae bacterium]|nr:P-loop NTPase [Paracoccaceae bacterium]
MAEPARVIQSGMVFEEDTSDREPFGAFYLDEATHAAAAEIAQLRGWSASSIRKGGLPTALRLLGVAPPPRIVFVDIEDQPLEEARQGLTELARTGASVVAFGSVNDVAYFRSIMRAGVRDYLVKPVTADDLGEVLVAIEQPGDGARPRGRLVGVIGARGGVGASTIAINTAWIMADRLSRRTGLVDMDIYAGSIALALDIEPTRGLREAFDDPKRVDEVFLQNAMKKIGKNLHVLATEEPFDDLVPMTDDKMLMLADTMHGNFDMSILDLPRHFILREPQLFARCDDFVVVAELTLQSLRDTNRLRKLLGLRNRKAKIHVIANRVSSRPDITVSEFEKGMESTLRCVFPLDTKAVTRASMEGRPLAATTPKHKIVDGLHKLCIELAGIPEDGRRKGLFGRKAPRKK